MIVNQLPFKRMLTIVKLWFPFQVIDQSDVILEVLDARDPLGYRCPQLEEAVLTRPGNKKLILVLTKIGYSSDAFNTK